MKRLTLLAVVLILTAIFVSSPLLASPPRIENRPTRLQSFFAQCMTYFLGPFPGFFEILPQEDSGSGTRLGGDADDYANGRTSGEDSRRDGRLKSNPIYGPSKDGPPMGIIFKK